MAEDLEAWEVGQRNLRWWLDVWFLVVMEEVTVSKDSVAGGDGGVLSQNAVDVHSNAIRASHIHRRGFC